MHQKLKKSKAHQKPNAFFWVFGACPIFDTGRFRYWWDSSTWYPWRAASQQGAVSNYEMVAKFAKLHVEVNFCPSLVPVKKSTQQSWWYTLTHSPITSHLSILLNSIFISIFVQFFLHLHVHLHPLLSLHVLIPSTLPLIYYISQFLPPNIYPFLFPLLCYPLSHKTTCIGNIICSS